MSKFTKRKHKSIETYDKCPSMALFRIANTLASDQNYMCENGISKVHLVADDEARLTERRLIDGGSEVYMTTSLLLNLINTHSINIRGAYSDRPKYFYTDSDGDTKTSYTPNQQRHYGHNAVHEKSITVACIDLLMYMKESKRSHVEVSVDNLMSINSNSSNNGILTYHRNENVNLKLATIPLISRRLEFTKVKNELLELHKDSTKTTNKIHSCDDTEELLCNFHRYFNGLKDKEGNRKSSSKFISYFVELGGQINQNNVTV